MLPQLTGSREAVPAEAERGSPEGHWGCSSMGQLGPWLLNPFCLLGLGPKLQRRSKR